MRCAFEFCFCLLLLGGSIFAGSDILDPIQKALGKYDPILPNDTILEGRIAFPELEKAMPGFYQQLFELMELHVRVSRSEFDLELRGKNDSMKELGQTFMQIEGDLTQAIERALKDDPYYSLERVRENLTAYDLEIIHNKSHTEYSFIRKLKGGSTSIPDRVVFEISDSGMLMCLLIKMRDSVAETQFQSILRNNKFYIYELNMTHSSSGIIRRRRVNFFYKKMKELMIPNMIRISEVDERGELVKKSMHLNPISLHLNEAKVHEKH